MHIMQAKENSLLAEISYVDFESLNLNDTDDIISALKADGRFTSTQANDFVENWRVVDHLPDTSSSFSATGFERLDDAGNETGQFTFAIRGSEDLADFQEDIYSLSAQGVAREQAVDLYRYYKRLITPEGQSVEYDTSELLMLTALENGSFNPITTSVAFLSILYQTSSDVGLGHINAETKIEVTGHSLGGHLSMMFTQLFPQSVEHVYTYNGAGIGGVWAELLEQAGFISDISSDLVTNIVADQGFDITAGFGVVIGDTERVFIEKGEGIQSHEISRLVDSLAVLDFLISVDPTVDLSSYANILHAADVPGTPEESLEKIVHGIADIISIPVSHAVDNREKFYEDLKIIKSELFVAYDVDNLVLKGKYINLKIEDLSPYGQSEIHNEANNNIAYRYALKNLNPFAITGNDGLYTAHNQDGELDLYDETTQEGDLTEEYLADRAHFLTSLIKTN